MCQCAFFVEQKMGIIYQVHIRSLSVHDKSKVNLEPLYEDSETDKEPWNKRLRAYYDESRLNIVKVLQLIKHHPCTRSGYSMLNLKLEEDSDVLSFSNNACDRRGDTIYEITFYNYFGKEIEFQSKKIECENNRFMILVPPEATSFKYVIRNAHNEEEEGYDVWHFFNYRNFCSSCLNCYCAEHEEAKSDEDPEDKPPEDDFKDSDDEDDATVNDNEEDDDDDADDDDA